MVIEEGNGCMIGWIFWDMDLGHAFPQDLKEWGEMLRTDRPIIV
jgi:hypothetical protein